MEARPYPTPPHPTSPADTIFFFGVLPREIDGDDRGKIPAVVEEPGAVEVGRREDDRALAANAERGSLLSHGDAKLGGGRSRDEGRFTGG